METCLRSLIILLDKRIEHSLHFSLLDRQVVLQAHCTQKERLVLLPVLAYIACNLSLTFSSVCTFLQKQNLIWSPPFPGEA